MHTEVGATEWLANLSVGYIVLATFVLTAIRLILVPSRSRFARSITELAESLMLAGVFFFLIIRPFFGQAFYIPTESMEPTLMGHDAGISRTGAIYPDTAHDHIFVNKLIYHMRDPQRGDIIVFRAEKKADVSAMAEGRDPQENILIKRLIGLPGDTIEEKRDANGVARVWINGKPLEEPYIKEPMNDPPSMDAHYAVDRPLKLSPNELFMMGDNRNHSSDSRYWGPLPRNRVIGKAMFIFWPIARIGIVR
jgi:signal peptidase I